MIDKYIPQLTDSLWTFPLNNIIDEVSYSRYCNAIEDGQTILEYYSEPYFDHPDRMPLLQQLLPLHAIARVIDDAVDIGLDPDRERILILIPILWKMAIRLQYLFPKYNDIILEIIEKWCHFNRPNQTHIDTIGHKSLHFILIEEILNDGKHRDILIKSFNILQVVDELEDLTLGDLQSFLEQQPSLISQLKQCEFIGLSKLLNRHFDIIGKQIHAQRNTR
tara:strand:+ start:251 stop:913 length:663 start_codon:yes stop_codon:yes gene_type:complete